MECLPGRAGSEGDDGERVEVVAPAFSQGLGGLPVDISKFRLHGTHVTE